MSDGTNDIQSHTTSESQQSELIVDELSNKHIGWQLNKGVLSGSVFEYEVRVWSGRNRFCWRLIEFDPQFKPTNMQWPLWEKPRIDLSSGQLKLE